MKALVLETGSKLEIKSNVPIPKPGRGEVLVQIKSAALNRRDFSITQGLYPKLKFKFPCILGSDGTGTVVSLGSEVDTKWLHREVVINPSINFGTENFSILGMPKDGTLAEYVVVPSDRLHDKPKHLDNVQAAALPLAGLTAFRAVMIKGEVKKGDKVLISSIGSGVSQFAAQIAGLAGAKVYVTSSSDEKIQRALKSLPIEGGFNYTSKDWKKDFLAKVGKVHVVIDGSGGENSSIMLSDLLNNYGKFVTYGATAGPPPQFPIHNVFLTHKSILGTTMGSDQDFLELINFVNTHKMVPLVGKHTNFEQVIGLIEELKSNDTFGKHVVSFAPTAKL